MKWFKRLLVLVAFALVILLIVSASGVYLYRGTPSWYHPRIATTQQTRDAANRADQKLLDLFSWAASAQAQQLRRRRGTADPNEPTIGPKTISFDEDEINSFSSAWTASANSQIEQRISHYFTDGRVVLQNDAIILAGQSPEFGTLVSARFFPKIDSGGNLHFDLDSLSAGRLPIPLSAVAGKMHRLQELLGEQLMLTQPSAAIDPAMTANSSAVSAAWIHLLLSALNDQPSDPILIIPFDMTNFGRGLPVKLTDIKVIEGSFKLTMQPISPDDRGRIVDRLKRP